MTERQTPRLQFTIAVINLISAVLVAVDRISALIALS